MQLVTDISKTPQVVPKETIGASYGDAFLAGLATGLVSRADLSVWVGETRTLEPNEELAPRYDELFEQYKALYEVTKGVVHKL